MPDNGRSTRNVVLIEALPSTVYRAFVDPDLVAQWLAPGEMTAHVHEFDAREGGEVRMSLHYPEGQHSEGTASTGKSTEDSDVYRARFVELVPDSKVVQTIEFESDDPAFAGEMRMTATMAPTRQGTNLTLAFDNIPEGIALEDNREGTALSLGKLSALVGKVVC